MLATPIAARGHMKLAIIVIHIVWYLVIHKWLIVLSLFELDYFRVV